MTDDFPIRRAQMEARLSKATPGPWHTRTGMVRTNQRREGELRMVATPVGLTGLRVSTSAVPVADCVIRDGETILNETWEANADLIAHAPTDLRACLDAYDRMRGRAEGLKTALRSVLLAFVNLHGNPEDCDDCGAMEDEGPCQIHAYGPNVRTLYELAFGPNPPEDTPWDGKIWALDTPEGLEAIRRALTEESHDQT